MFLNHGRHIVASRAFRCSDGSCNRLAALLLTLQAQLEAEEHGVDVSKSFVAVNSG